MKKLSDPRWIQFAARLNFRKNHVNGFCNFALLPVWKFFSSRTYYSSSAVLFRHPQEKNDKSSGWSKHVLFKHIFAYTKSTILEHYFQVYGTRKKNFAWQISKCFH